MAAICTFERDNGCNVNYSETLLEERGQARRAAKTTNIFRFEFSICDQPGSGERSNGALTWTGHRGFPSEDRRPESWRVGLQTFSRPFVRILPSSEGHPPDRAAQIGELSWVTKGIEPS